VGRKLTGLHRDADRGQGGATGVVGKGGNDKEYKMGGGALQRRGRHNKLPVSCNKKRRLGDGIEYYKEEAQGQGDICRMQGDGEWDDRCDSDKKRQTKRTGKAKRQMECIFETIAKIEYCDRCEVQIGEIKDQDSDLIYCKECADRCELCGEFYGEVESVRLDGMEMCVGCREVIINDETF